MKLDILNNVFIKESRLLLELSAPASFKSALPGQFIHVRIEDSYDPILRRPFSIYDVCESRKKNRLTLRVLYEVVGKGTQLLSQKKPLCELDCLGPLGHGFDLERIAQAKKAYLVAGGMGVAPLFFLAKKLIEKRKSKIEGFGPIVLIGAKTKNDILREKEFKDLGCQVHVATDDGSKGFKGFVTDLLRSFLTSPRATVPGPKRLPDAYAELRRYPARAGNCAGAPLSAVSPRAKMYCAGAPLSAVSPRAKMYCAGAPLSAAICACGPKPMLASLSGIVRKYNIPAQVSLEEFMGCGLGACLGCVIRTTSGYKRICHDGPVFDSSEMIWKE